MKRIVLIFSFLLFLSLHSKAQMTVRDSSMASWMFSFNLGGYLSSADLADRYGNSLGLGMDFDRKTRKNWLFGVNGTYFFGSTVHNLYDIFGALATEQGALLTLSGEYAGADFLSRGFYLGGHVGKIFPVIGPNPNSGILIKMGAGYSQNKIHIRTPNIEVPQIQGEYAKGYDRLHDGITLHQFIGFIHSGNNRTLNFLIGFEFYEGFTKSVRQFNYNSGMIDESLKLDVYLGLKLGWFLPIYDKNQQKFYYY